MIYKKVLSIKKVGKRKVYNISVKDNYNFFLGNGILSHNSFGRVGGGKSVSTLSLCQGYKDNYNYKFWYIYGGERCEHLYTSLPSVDDNYWQTKISQIGRFDEQGPKQYKVKFLYPYFGIKLPKKLPQKKINKEIIVESELFTVPLKSVIVEDISTVIGIVSETSKYCWNEILERTNKKDNAGSLVEIASKIKGITNTPLYKNFVLPMSREKFLMDNYCETNIDLVDEAKDRETISVLCLDFVPKAFHIFIINWMARNLNELLDANKIPKKNICLMIEAATFFRATDDSVLDDRFKIFRSNMANYMRMSRRGVYWALDCQSPAETRGILSGSDDIMLMFKTTSFRDKEEMTQELRRENRMRPDQIADLAFLDKGCCYLAETGRNVKKVQITLPRTMYWKKEYGNFYKNVWPKYGGEWKLIDEIKDKIDVRCQERHDALMPKKKEFGFVPKVEYLSEDELSPPDEEELMDQEPPTPQNAINPPQNPEKPFDTPKNYQIKPISELAKLKKKEEIHIPEVVL
jgi:hypothetical protein